ncbi:MAG TPA: aspartate/glutamate racemase family protein [Candidatus Acidoferrum sp.]|nr:aspartate/glutamate racemase family protein [Candidatus Acidoferrum sp.]
MTESRTGVAGGKQEAIKVVLVHGTSVVIPIMEEVIRVIDRRITVLHVLSEPLLQDLLAMGCITPEITWRFVQLVVEGARTHPHLIVVTGSSFGACVASAQECVPVPVLRVDERMAREAAAAGQRIAVVATESTTIAPTTALIQQQATALGKTVEVEVMLCEGAMALLRQGQPALHDARVLDCLQRRGAKDVDVIVLAQVSLARVQPQVETLTGERVLTSPGTVALMIRDALP